MLKKLIKDNLEKIIISTLGHEFSDFELTHPQNETYGDFTLNIALKASKKISRSADKIALELSEEIRRQTGLFEKIETVPPGFINLTIKREHLLNELKEILDKGESYGFPDLLKNKKVAVEYTDPNPFKEFHVGHLYSNIVGECLANLKEAIGAKVFRCDYFGDVGLHVAKSVWGLIRMLREAGLQIDDLKEWEQGKRIEYLGKAYAVGAYEFENKEDVQAEVKELNALIFKAAQEVVLPQFKETPQINYDSFIKGSKYDYEEVKILYLLGRQWSLQYFETIYRRLGTKFDGYYPESRTGEFGYGMVLKGLKKGIFEKGENGAVIFPGSKYGLHERVFINSLGLPTYETKDFGNAVAKDKDFPYDESVIITGNEINEYFVVVLKALTLLYPDLGRKTIHIGHGMVRLPEGKISSRMGRVIRGEWLLDEAKKKALEIIKKVNKDGGKSMDLDEVAEGVGQAAIKYALLKSAVGKDIEFDFEESVSFEGNSGPYLQYSYARAKSVLRKNQKLKIKGQGERRRNLNSELTIPDSLLSEELILLRTLYKFPEVIEASALNYQPHLLCGFLYDLAQKFNLFYNNLPILQGKSETRNPDFRLSLTAACATIIKNGLRILGIQTLERM